MLSVTKSGPGTWVLGAINTYSGRTSVNGGILKVAGSSNLGNASVTNDVALAGGGTLQATGALNSAARNVTLNSGGGAIDTNGHPVAFGDVDGSSSFSKLGAQTLRVNHVRSGNLTVAAGKLAVVANGVAPGVRVVSSTAVTGGAQLDLSDNHLIDHTTGPGTWNGSSYDGLTGLIASGRNTGNWDGSGIVTSQTQAIGSNYTSLGIARASDVRPATATATDLWAGQTITGTDTLVMYTYGGDATLDGKINIDDYVKIDPASPADGRVGSTVTSITMVMSIDDHINVIDANIGNQTSVFSREAAPGRGLQRARWVTAVPPGNKRRDHWGGLGQSRTMPPQYGDSLMTKRIQSLRLLRCVAP